MLEDRDYSVISTNNLTQDFFYSCQNEFNFIKNHYERYHTIPDIETFSDYFPEFRIYKVSEPITYLMEKLSEDYNKAMLGVRFNKIKELLEKGDTNKAMEYYLRAAENLRTVAAVQSTDMLTNEHRKQLYIDKLEQKIAPFLGTGFRELDEAIGGIDPNEENMVIIARTGVGKSWILVKMAVAAFMQGLRVGIYSGEMSSDKVGYRIDTILAQELTQRGYGTFTLHNKELNRGQNYKGTADTYERYFSAVKAFADTNGGAILVTEPSMIAGEPTVSALQSFIEKENLDILFIDQYSLLEDTSNAKALHEKVANISKDIKKLQVRKKKPIISVAQMNRSGQDSRDKEGKKVKVEFGTEQIGLTDRIGQDATIVLALSKNTLDNGNYELEILPLKARDGGEGKALCYNVDLDTGVFTFIPEEAKNAEGKSSDTAKSMRNEYDENGEYDF